MPANSGESFRQLAGYTPQPAMCGRVDVSTWNPMNDPPHWSYSRAIASIQPGFNGTVSGSMNITGRPGNRSLQNSSVRMKRCVALPG